jgi:hypothetical protein
MNMRLPGILALAFASATASAQPAERDHRHPAPPPPPPPVDRDHRHGPGLDVVINATVAPPAPQVENPGAKAGFEWVPGRYDWKGGKWEWMGGHWERERAGKHWRPGRWEQRGGGWAFVDGEWIDAGAAGAMPPPGAAPPPPGAMPPPPGEHHHHDWKMDRPVVSSYWPAKGKPGRKVVIKGENFPPDAAVFFGPTQITAAKITPTEIVFDVPANATGSGEIYIKRAHARDLPVGMFEVAASFDPEAEARKLEDARHKAAEDAWKAQQSRVAKDKAAREAAWKAHWQEMENDRETRRERREAEIRAKWDAAFLNDADTQAELALHAQRVAQLSQAASIAEVNANEKLGVRIQVATAKENDRHEQRMAALKAGFSAKTGAP